jgi:hypothetical protein
LDSIGGCDRRVLFFLHQPLGQRQQLRTIAPVTKREEAFHQPQAGGRDLVRIQPGKLGWHLDAIHYRYPGLEAVTQPSLDKIIEQLQFCIVDAKALQLKMLERLLSIALLEAYESKEKSGNGHGNGEL